ncbi:hypothetical protein PZ894_17845 [Nocardioides sp. YIM 152315]|nr:hypothetical protein [Nocardioides sp. YIM 152315]
MRRFSELSPAQKARRVGAVMLTAIFLVLLIFLLITWRQGDPANDRGQRLSNTPPSATAA